MRVPTIAPSILALTMGALFSCNTDNVLAPPDDLTISANRETGGAFVAYRYFAGFARPDVAESSDGQRIVIRGTGTFTLHPKSITGGGTFEHTDAAGNPVASGTWTAVRLQSFQSYGPSPNFPDNWRAGTAVIGVRLTPDGGGPELGGQLWIGCILPGGEDDDPGGAFEGSKLAVEGGPNFNRIVPFSPTLFIQL